MTGVLTTGVHNIPAEFYHSDPTPEPSLSSGGIKTLLGGSSPAEFAANHPRLTQWPELLDSRSKAKDLGSIIHSLVLGVGAGFHACDPQDCPARTKKGEPYKTWSGDATAWKEAQEAEGIVIMSRKEGARVQSAAKSMIELLRNEYGDWPIGDSERTLIWQRQTSIGPIWCRAMLDHLALRHMVILDPKSTSLGISKRVLQKTIAREMWAIQAAWYLEAVENCFPDVDLAGRLRFRFPVVEVNPPYQSKFVGMSEARLSIARQRIDRAAETFAKCLAANDWPEDNEEFISEPETWEINEFEEEETK
jgi:hypothetical protein